MQFTLALLSGLTLVTSAVAQDKLPRALDFTTFPCIECARTGPDGCGSRQINHHDRFSDTCYPLEAGQESIRVDHVNDANHNCALYLYGSTNCTGSGPVFGFEAVGSCRPIPVNERTSYQILC